ncbi:FAD-dependent oxidoreductase [Catellatospora bangladeshensis]|uniref:FAD-dependent oxidoreductase n=1 Tax=Catellatospora bangladeshensis TaxID=310355 RepID=UPI00360E8EA1
MSADVNVVIVGGGLAGVACAKRLAGKPGMRVELIDRAGFQQFQPLLYQVATAELTSKDVRFDLDRLFRHHPSVNVRKDDVTAIDPGAMTVTLASGDTLTADHLVLAAGAQPNFFETPAPASTRSRCTASRTRCGSAAGCSPCFRTSPRTRRWSTRVR